VLLIPLAQSVTYTAILKAGGADSQVKLEFILRELGSMIFAKLPRVRVRLPDGRGSLFLDFDCPFSLI
jgi:hypothetical protein